MTKHFRTKALELIDGLKIYYRVLKGERLYSRKLNEFRTYIINLNNQDRLFVNQYLNTYEDEPFYQDLRNIFIELFSKKDSKVKLVFAR